MTHSGEMRIGILLAVLFLLPNLHAQSADEDFKVYTDHPRLFLKAQHLKMLKKERERKSDRWLQLELLIKGKAQLPEPGFSNALYYQITGEESSAKEAIAFALGVNADLRQMALVFDWCQPVLSPDESRRLAAKIKAGINQSAAKNDVGTVSASVIAAVALADAEGYDAQDFLGKVVRNWWRKQVAPELNGGRRILSTADVYPLMELLHTVRDNTNVDLRENAPKYFKVALMLFLLNFWTSS